MTPGEIYSETLQRLRRERDEARAEAQALHPDSLRAARFPWLYSWSKKLRQARATVEESELFDESHYRSQFPHTFPIKHALTHYLVIGWKLNFSPNPLFDNAFFAEKYPCGNECPLVVYLRSDPSTTIPHPYFDPPFYKATSPDVAQSGVHPLGHFLKLGAWEGRPPNALFDPAFYAASFPELDATRTNPLFHYLSIGRWLGINPHPLFHTKFYESTLSSPPWNEDSFAHYLQRGMAEKAKPHPLFDPAYYESQIPEGDLKGSHPVPHFLKHGRTFMASPCPLFDFAYYILKHPEASGETINPLTHYLSQSHATPELTHRLFDVAYYTKHYPDSLQTDDPLSFFYHIGAARGDKPNILFDTAFYQKQLGVSTQNPLEHYVMKGWKEGFHPNEFFDPNYYLQTYPDIRNNNLEPLTHYMETGWHDSENRNPCPEFDTAYYKQRSPDIRELGIHPLGHYLEKGRSEGRKIRPCPTKKTHPPAAIATATATDYRELPEQLLPIDSYHRLIADGRTREFAAALQASRDHTAYLEIMARQHFSYRAES